MEASGKFTFPINNGFMASACSAYGAVNGDTTKIAFIELNGSWMSSPSPSTFPKTATIDGKVYRWTIQETAEAFGDTYVKKAKLNIGNSEHSFLVINKPFFSIECGGKTGTYSFYNLGKLESGWMWDPEASDIEIDGKQKVPINIENGTGIELSADATYRFTWSLGNRSYSTTKSITAGKTRIETSYQVPKEWNDQITAAQSGTMYLKIESIFGTQVYQSMEAYIHASVPDDCVPVINSITVADKRGRVPAAWKMFVQDQSNVALTAMDASISYGSAIKSVVMEVGEKKYTGTTDDLPASGTFKDYGVVDITVTVTDGRGRTAEKTAKITVVEYSPPTLSVDSMRCGSDGSIENEGVYFLAMTDSTWSGCNGKNVPTLTIAYKLTSERNYRTPKSLTPGEGVTTVCGGDLDTEFSYDVQYILKDTFNTVTVIDYVSTAVYLMHFLHGGRGVAFGSKATMENYADFAFNAIFRGTCEFEKPNGEKVKLAQIIDKLGL